MTGSRIVDAAFCKFRFKRELLAWKQGYFGFKSFVPTQSDLNRVFSGHHEHSPAHPVELIHVTHEIIIQEDRRPLRMHINSYFGARFGVRIFEARISFHDRMDIHILPAQ